MPGTYCLIDRRLRLRAGRRELSWGWKPLHEAYRCPNRPSICGASPAPSVRSHFAPAWSRSLPDANLAPCLLAPAPDQIPFSSFHCPSCGSGGARASPFAPPLRTLWAGLLSSHLCTIPIFPPLDFLLTINFCVQCFAFRLPLCAVLPVPRLLAAGVGCVPVQK